MSVDIGYASFKLESIHQPVAQIDRGCGDLSCHLVRTDLPDDDRFEEAETVDVQTIGGKLQIVE